MKKGLEVTKVFLKDCFELKLRNKSNVLVEMFLFDLIKVDGVIEE